MTYYTTHSELATSEQKSLAAKYRWPTKGKEGDLLLDRALDTAQHYLVADGEDLRRATHVFEDGDWKLIDDGNARISITVPRRAGGSAESSVFAALQSAVFKTKAGRILERSAVSEIIDSVMECLGMGSLADGADTLELDDSGGMRRVHDALINLLQWAPESGYPRELAQMGHDHDNVGFFASVDEYQDFLNNPPAPFLSKDPAFYAALGGKHDGRALRGRIRELMEAAGVDDEELR